VHLPSVPQAVPALPPQLNPRRHALQERRGASSAGASTGGGGLRRSARRLLDLTAVLLGLLAPVGLVAHFLPSRLNVLVAVSAGSTHLMALAPVSASLAAVRRLRRTAAVAGVLTAAAVATVLPTHVGGPSGGGTPQLTVLTVNLGLGEADAAGVVAAGRSADADVVLLQELTPATQEALAGAGLEDLLPHTVVDARPGAHGAGLWSRFRLVDDQRHDRLVFAAVSARLDE
jgi:endonuclease/exonuclease/phosphatase (EEP) superfamily protein YafD